MYFNSFIQAKELVFLHITKDANYLENLKVRAKSKNELRKVTFTNYSFCFVFNCTDIKSVRPVLPTIQVPTEQYIRFMKVATK